MNNIDIKATLAFDRKAEKIMSADAKEDLFDHLLVQPESGIIISGTGGIRKLRWPSGLNNKGKSGGVRIIYHYVEDYLLIILITVYSKSEKDDLSDAQKNELERALPELIEKYRGES